MTHPSGVIFPPEPKTSEQVSKFQSISGPAQAPSKNAFSPITTDRPQSSDACCLDKWSSQANGGKPFRRSTSRCSKRPPLVRLESNVREHVATNRANSYSCPFEPLCPPWQKCSNVSYGYW